MLTLAALTIITLATSIAGTVALVHHYRRETAYARAVRKGNRNGRNPEA